MYIHTHIYTRRYMYIYIHIHVYMWIYIIQMDYHFNEEFQLMRFQTTQVFGKDPCREYVNF